MKWHIDCRTQPSIYYLKDLRFLMKKQKLYGTSILQDISENIQRHLSSSSSFFIYFWFDSTSIAYTGTKFKWQPGLRMWRNNKRLCLTWDTKDMLTLKIKWLLKDSEISALNDFFILQINLSLLKRPFINIFVYSYIFCIIVSKDIHHKENNYKTICWRGVQNRY